MSKQFLELLGLPILMHTMKKFQQTIPEGEIILALPEKEQSTWQSLCEKYHFDVPHQIVNGGESRFHSVQNALQKVKEKDKEYKSLTIKIGEIFSEIEPIIKPSMLIGSILNAKITVIR